MAALRLNEWQQQLTFKPRGETEGAKGDGEGGQRLSTFTLLQQKDGKNEKLDREKSKTRS